jgi:hypothetical protein
MILLLQDMVENTSLGFLRNSHSTRYKYVTYFWVMKLVHFGMKIINLSTLIWYYTQIVGINKRFNETGNASSI